MRRALRALCAASAWASFLLSSAAVRAGDAQPTQTRADLATEAKPGVKAEPDAGPAKPAIPTPAPPSATEGAAEAAYQRALATYATGDVKGAFDAMRESYRLSQRPELLYNLARLEHELQECQASLEDYRRYLQRVPNGRYRDAAEQACRELEQECPAADPAQAAAPPVPVQQPGPAADRTVTDKPQPPPLVKREPVYWTTPHVLAWSAIGAGVIAGSAALYFTVAAKAAQDNFQTSINRAQKHSDIDMTLQDRLHRDETAAQVLGVTSGVLVTGGVLLLIFGPGTAKAAGNASLYFPAGGLGACYSHGF